jgi:hypothetical protein
MMSIRDPPKKKIGAELKVRIQSPPALQQRVSNEPGAATAAGRHGSIIFVTAELTPAGGLWTVEWLRSIG